MTVLVIALVWLAAATVLGLLIGAAIGHAERRRYVPGPARAVVSSRR